jgi:hypothetical protein
LTRRQWIRWTVLLFPVLMALVVVVANVTTGCFQVSGWLLLLALFLAPNTVYFFATLRMRSLILLLAPAIPLCLFEVLVDVVYLSSTNSTAGILFVFTPFYELAIVGVGLLVGALADLLVRKIRSRQAGLSGGS